VGAHCAHHTLLKSRQFVFVPTVDKGISGILNEINFEVLSGVRILLVPTVYTNFWGRAESTKNGCKAEREKGKMSLSLN
jgi:hypothetical protein